ncbi:hypothetical protein HanIR_Chr08g0389271 [Helianthus annuus]|nr:hypothetical protein HanIR_Chr08g0389271 [Helianthus annuus]
MKTHCRKLLIADVVYPVPYVLTFYTPHRSLFFIFRNIKNTDPDGSRVFVESFGVRSTFRQLVSSAGESTQQGYAGDRERSTCGRTRSPDWRSKRWFSPVQWPDKRPVVNGERNGGFWSLEQFFFFFSLTVA